MKFQIVILALLISMSASADTVNKWTDEQGKVHYGDKNAAELVKETETLKIKDTYDPQAYEEGMERHKETQEIADQLEKDRLEEEEKRDKEEKEKKSSAPARPGGSAIEKKVPANNASSPYQP